MAIINSKGSRKGCSLMNWNIGRKIFVTLCMFILLTACGSRPAGSNVSPGGSVAVEGACANEYYPVVQGAAWTYESVGSPAGKYVFTDTVSAVQNDGFTLTSKYGDLIRTQEWGCQEQGLVALQLGGPATATLGSQDMDFTFDVKNVEGVTYPTSMLPGEEWMHALEFESKMNIANEPAAAIGNAQTQFMAFGQESITVPAGTFQALRVQVDTNITFTIQVQGISVPVSFSGSYTYWFARGVGWVKAQGEGNITGTSFTETIELQDYRIP